MSNQLNKQQGGILAFIVVGIVLAALLAGGIYVSKNHGRQVALAPTSDTPPVVVDDSKTQDTKQPENSPAPTVKNDDKNTSDQSSSQAQPQQGSASTSTNQQTPPSVATTGPSTIATTGPADGALTIVALAALTAGASTYRRSIMRMRAAALHQ